MNKTISLLLVSSLFFGSGCVKNPVPVQKSFFQPTSTFVCPLKKVEVLSSFGPRGRRFHTGIDLRGKRGGGDSVLAAREGKVMKAGRMRGYGQIIILRHADGSSSRYAHLKKMLVHQGENVEKLQEIGIVGRTGRATTEHLHFEILDPKSRYLNPGPLIFEQEAHR